MKKNKNGLSINLNLNSGARKSKVIELVNSGNVHSQTDLVKQLAKAGIKVTQATASRDLELLGAVRGKSADGVMRYAFVADSTNSVNANLSNAVNSLAKLIISISTSANIAVLKTPPGAADLVAGRIDRAISNGKLKNVLGTVAGDDTILVISKSKNAQSIVKPLNDLFEVNGGKR
jgi:transcriptional regulator of arginine metabolism